MIEIIALFALAVWVYLLAVRGRFWLAGERDDRPEPPAPAAWPGVVAVIPARDEAASIGQTVQSLLAQDYPGLEIDRRRRRQHRRHRRGCRRRRGGGWRARAADRAAGPAVAARLDRQGVGAEAGRRGSAGRTAPRYLLLTDADIVYAPGALKRIVARAERGRTALTSVMVKLRCESLAERAFIPAFVFFFQMLYPFAWVNRPRTRDRRGGRRLHAGARRCARRVGRHRRHPQRADRRLRAGRADQSGRPDLARPDRKCTQHPHLRHVRTDPPHGDALGLCAIALFAAAASRRDARHGADVSGRAAARALRLRHGGAGRARRRG